MSFNGFDLTMLEKAMDRAGMHLGCVLGIHDWGYQAKNTGIYLHTFLNGTLPKPRNYYSYKKRCWRCYKIEMFK